jgi:hypothetical protein
LARSNKSATRAVIRAFEPEMQRHRQHSGGEEGRRNPMYGIQVLIEKDGRLQWQNAKAFGADTFYQYTNREHAEDAAREISIHQERVRVVQLLRK